MNWFLYSVIAYFLSGFLGYFIAHNKITLKTIVLSIPCSFYGFFSYFVFKDIVNSNYEFKSGIIIGNTEMTYIDVPTTTIYSD